jgi:hypothetical protein
LDLLYAHMKDLFVSGLLDGGDEIAGHAAVIDVLSACCPVGAVFNRSDLA